MRSHGKLSQHAFAASALVVVAAACIDLPPATRLRPGDPPPYQPRFISADPTGGIAAPANPSPEPPLDNGGHETQLIGSSGAHIALDNGLHALVNAYRGIDLLDLSDPDSPRVVGTVPLAASSVAFYARGTTLFVLTSSRFPATELARVPTVIEQQRGAIAVIDLSDPAAPLVLDEIALPGAVAGRWLKSVGDAATLYVAVAIGDPTDLDDGEHSTVLMRFDVSAGSLVPLDELELPGRLTGLQWNDDVALIARVENNRHTVTLFDVTDLTGALVARGTAAVAGEVQALDLFQGVLRVVVTAETWGYEVQTFDATGSGVLPPLDSVRFGGDAEQLSAGVFVGNIAFLVTTWVEDPVDPIHVFEIGDDGAIVERLEIVEPGWNDLLVSVLGDTRLVGIGRNAARVPLVRLYDFTDLTNQTPLVAEAAVRIGDNTPDFFWGPSTVLEDTVSVPAPSGDVTETGLVLLSFRTYDEPADRIVYGTQLFTFSSTTLTRRGMLEHGTPVRRTLRLEDGSFATLSDVALTVWDAADLDAPVALARLALTENSVDWLPLQNGSSARIIHRADYDSAYWYDGAPQQPGAIEVLAPGADPNDDAIASIDLDGKAMVFATGSTLVAIDGPWPPPNDPAERLGSQVAVFDLSDPTSPVLARTLFTERLPFTRAPAPQSWCAGCARVPYMPSPDVHALPGALVFVSRIDVSASMGPVEFCRLWPERAEQCNSLGLCHYHAGELECVRPLGDDEATCRGAISYCTGRSGEPSCEAIDHSGLELNRDCRESVYTRGWQRMSLMILDVRDPNEASLIGPIDLPQDARPGAVVVDGSTLWVSIARIVDVPDDTRAWQGWLAVPIDLRIPAYPVVGEAIEVPGELLKVAAGEALTRDWHFDGWPIEGSINRVALDLQNTAATLIRSERFAGRDLQRALLDGAGHVLVDDRARDWRLAQLPHITVLDAELDPRASFDLERGAVLRAAVAGRVLEQVDYGHVVVLNLDDPSAPYAQASFPVRDWPASAHARGDDIVIPRGRFGITQFDRDFENVPMIAP